MSYPSGPPDLETEYSHEDLSSPLVPVLPNSGFESCFFFSELSEEITDVKTLSMYLSELENRR